jgi:hypothetical protein
VEGAGLCGVRSKLLAAVTHVATPVVCVLSFLCARDKKIGPKLASKTRVSTSIVKHLASNAIHEAPETVPFSTSSTSLVHDRWARANNGGGEGVRAPTEQRALVTGRGGDGGT